MSVRVSVVVPTFGSPALLGPCLASIAAQDLPASEVLVACDGPATPVVRSLVAWAGARLIEGPPVGHPSPGRQRATEAAAEPYVAYLDHDDAWQPDHLRRLDALVAAGADMAVSGVELHDAAGKAVGRSSPLGAVWHPKVLDFDPFCEPSRVLLRRDAVIDAGGWRRGAGLEDWNLWRRLRSAGVRVACHTRPTARMLLAATSRRHALRPTGHLTLGTAARAREPDWPRGIVRAGEAAAARLADAQAWLRWLVRQTETVLPPGWDAARIDRCLHDPLTAEAGLEHRALVRLDAAAARASIPVYAASREEAIAAVAGLEARHAQELRVLRAALAA